MEQNALLQFAPLVVLFAIFYFLLIRPQQKQAKRHAEMLAALKKGDKIITSGGFFAEVVAVEDAAVKIRMGENLVRIQKQAIAALQGDEAAAAAAAANAANAAGADKK